MSGLESHGIESRRALASAATSAICAATPSAMLKAIQRQAAYRTRMAAASTLAEMNAAAAQLALARVTKAVAVTSASVGIAKHSISRSARLMSGLNMRTQA